MIIMWCKLNIKICCHLIEKKNDTQSVHVPVYLYIIYRRLFDTICIHFQCSFPPLFLQNLVAMTKYLYPIIVLLAL